MKRPGFTLIELMIYVAITAMVVVALTHVMIAILETREKTQQVGELQHSLRFSMDRMMERVLSAEEIDAPSSRFLSDRGILGLVMADAEKTPTVFSVSAGRIFLQEGKNDPEPLTPESIHIESLRFRKIGADRIHVMIEGIDPTAGTGSSAMMTLQTSVSLRP